MEGFSDESVLNIAAGTGGRYDLEVVSGLFSIITVTCSIAL